VIDVGCQQPIVNRSLDPIGYRYRSDVTSFADQVNNSPMIFENGACFAELLGCLRRKISLGVEAPGENSPLLGNDNEGFGRPWVTK
jgi:hypothetical protein